MKKVKFALVGFHGRMGREIAEYIEEKKLGTTAQIDFSKSNKKNPDVVIDFSSPEGFRETLAGCVKNKIPFVSGTTGITKEDQKALVVAGKKIPVFWAPNTSLGVQVFKEIIEHLGPVLMKYDLQIEEVHHVHKKDSPSGTGIRLQEALEKSTKRKAPPILAARGGGVYGIHKLLILGEYETLTIEHTALSRKLFAEGAVKAALWLIDKKSGLYSMDDFVKASE
jgi:4-hydroxy-tetrahydrodipicolinate reductase